MKHCATCNLEYPETSRFCKLCGKELADKQSLSPGSDKCPSCGAAKQSGWKFCKQCGHAFDKSTVVRSHQVGSVPFEFSVSCSACGFAQPPGTTFCGGCGRPFTTAAEKTGRTYQSSKVAAAGAAAAPAFAPTVAAASVAEPPAPKEEKCRACGHLSKPGAETCEACGGPVGSYARKLRAKRLGIAASVAVGFLLLATGVGAAGWYALGVRVAIQTDPGKSKIIIDGQEVGKTNSYGAFTTARLRTGDHSLIVTCEGYDEWKQSFNIAFTEFSKSLNIKLNPTKYRLTVVSSPYGSEVLVDNNSMGTTSDANGILETLPIAPGEHTVVVRKDGYRDWKQTVALKADLKLDVTLSAAPVYDESSYSADSDLRNALEGWAQSSRNRDIDSHMRYYSDTLDYYYSRTLVPSSKVREDRQKAYNRFNYLSVQLSNINVQLDSTGQRATVVLDKTFDFRGDNNAFYSGSVQNQLTLTKLGGAWLITGEKELKVYYVNK